MSHSTTTTTTSHKRDPLRPASVGGPDEAPSSPHQHGPNMGTYWVIIIVLMVLLIATVAAGFLPHSGGIFNVGIALAIAAIKATLVILFFMHVVEANRLTKLFVAGTFIWLVVMFAFTFTDYLSRSWTQASRGWDVNPTMVAEHHVFIEGDSKGYEEHVAALRKARTAPTSAPAAKE